VLRAPNEEFLTIKNFFTIMGSALGFEAGNIAQNQIETEGVGDGF
jgi:hypothetical protein